MRLLGPLHAGCGAVLVLLLLSSSGCVTLYIGGKLPRAVVETKTTPATQTVTIDSEPRGARVTKNGVALGTTPAKVNLLYDNAEREKRRQPCWAMIPFGLADLAAGGAGVWGSYLGYERTHDPWGVIGMIAASLYGGLALAAALSELATSCRISAESPVVVAHEHTVQLDYRGFQESLVVRVPIGSSSSDAALVLARFSGLDAADWERALELGTKAAFAEYLDQHPSGSRRDGALDRIDALDWETARQQDSETGYRQYLKQHPSGRWRHEAQGWLEKAEARTEETAWQEASERDTIASWARYLDHCSPRCRGEAHSRHWQAARRQDTSIAYTQYLAHCAPGCNDEARSRLLEARWRESILAWWKSRPRPVVPDIPLASIPTVVEALRAAGASTQDLVGLLAELAGRDRRVVGFVILDPFPSCLRAIHQAGASPKDLARIITRSMASAQNVQGAPLEHMLIKSKETGITQWTRSGKGSIVLDDRWESALTSAGLGPGDIAALNAALLASGAGASRDDVRRAEPSYK